jgi:hypothetical protein
MSTILFTNIYKISLSTFQHVLESRRLDGCSTVCARRNHGYVEWVNVFDISRFFSKIVPLLLEFT